jgi:L-alanine-DL-glutamate epimerase-like enolase superfamily enzyme
MAGAGPMPMISGGTPTAAAAAAAMRARGCRLCSRTSLPRATAAAAAPSTSAALLPAVSTPPGCKARSFARASMGEGRRWVPALMLPSLDGIWMPRVA